jgi:hypothetical protein
VSLANFLVTKTFSDGNDDEVQVTLTCNNGLPLEQSFMISEGHPVNFVLTQFTDGVPDCEVTETDALMATRRVTTTTSRQSPP